MKEKNELMPDILYKYRDDSEYTEKLIIDKKVWLSSPVFLNDPLECRIGEIPKDWEEKTIHELEQGQIMGVVMPLPDFKPPKTLFSLNERATKQWLKRFRNLNHDRKIKAMRALYSEHGMELSKPQDIFKDMRKRLTKVGIFSLSETCCNELMWAHYGANHKGITFGFSTSGECRLASERHCLSVLYSKEKPKFNGGFKNEVQIMAPGSGLPNIQRISFEDDTFRSTISTKTLAWEYEKEWRYIEETSGLFDFPGALSQVIFGLRMSSERKKYYKELVLKNINNRVDFYEVVENGSLNGIEVKEINVR
jgi:hypothetical protein